MRRLETHYDIHLTVDGMPRIMIYIQLSCRYHASDKTHYDIHSICLLHSCAKIFLVPGSEYVLIQHLFWPCRWIYPQMFIQGRRHTIDSLNQTSRGRHRRLWCRAMELQWSGSVTVDLLDTIHVRRSEPTQQTKPSNSSHLWVQDIFWSSCHHALVSHMGWDYSNKKTVSGTRAWCACTSCFHTKATRLII